MKVYLVISLVAFIFLAGCLSKNSDSAQKQQFTTESAAMTSPSSKQLRHVVLFKFKENATKKDIALVENAFVALPDKIPQIRDFEWGTNNSPEGLDKGFTHCFFLTFDSEEDREIYLPHPDHKAFGETIGPYIEDVLVVDYWIE